jgi:positive regulator of sigma E activity
MSTPPQEPVIKTWQQQALFVGLSALLPLVGLMLSLWLLSRNARRESLTMLAAAILGAVIWWILIG